MRNRSDQALIRITCCTKRPQLSLLKIKKLTQCLLVCLRQAVELHLTFVSDVQIKRINRLYHRTNHVTDVLAFQEPFRWPQLLRSKKFLGEVIVSIDRACAHAKQFCNNQDEELMRYVTHGVLHLLGERDHTKKAHAKMFKRQERLLNILRPIPKVIR